MLPVKRSPIDGNLSDVRGRSMNKDPIIPNTWKIIAVVAVLFSVTLIVLAHYTGNGTLATADWVTTGLKYTAWIVGGAQVLSIPLLIVYYCHKSAKRQHIANINAAKDIDPDLNPDEYRSLYTIKDVRDDSSEESSSG